MAILFILNFTKSSKSLVKLTIILIFIFLISEKIILIHCSECIQIYYDYEPQILKLKRITKIQATYLLKQMQA